MKININIQPKIKARVKLFVETWRTIKQLPEPILVIIFIVVLGFGGWYEYNGGKDVLNVLWLKDNSQNYDPIALKSLRYLTESEILYNHEENDEVNAVAFSADSNILASGGDYGKIKLWNVNKDFVNAEKKPSSDQEVTIGNDSEEPNIASIAFSPDGKTLAASNWSGLIQLWQLSESENAESTDAETFCDSKSSANSAKWKPCKNLKYPENPAYSVAFRPNPLNQNDDTLLAIGNLDGTIRLWNINKRDTWLIDDNYKHDDPVFSVAFSQDGQTLASGGYDGTVKLWKVDGDNGLILQDTLQHSRDYSVRAITFYTKTTNEITRQTTEQLASVSRDGTIKLWDIDKKVKVESQSERESQSKEHKPIESFESRNEILTLAVSNDDKNDDKILATGSEDGTIQLWNLSNGKLVRTLKGHPYAVYSLAFSPDGHFLASGSMDETIKLWKINKRVYLGWTGSLPMSLIF